MESRPHEGFVYRRRACGACYRTFVSREESPVGLKMPNETQSRYRVTDLKPKPEQTNGVIRSSGEHLANFWR
jgi:hypothetical protein